ncbi:hypothetical protein BgiBS90_027932, partial [Biomphalaria glabrata]
TTQTQHSNRFVLSKLKINKLRKIDCVWLNPISLDCPRAAGQQLPDSGHYDLDLVVRDITSSSGIRDERDKRLLQANYYPDNLVSVVRLYTCA